MHHSEAITDIKPFELHTQSDPQALVKEPQSQNINSAAMGIHPFPNLFAMNN